MKTPRLLIAEDDPAYQLSLEILLEKLGYDFRIAASGAEALQKTQQIHFDLALLDIHLEGAMTGIDVARALKQHFDFPIVFLTSNDDLDTYEKARQAADAAYLVKPVNELTLRSVIETALRNSSFDLHPDKTPKNIEKQYPTTSEFIFLKHKGRTERVEIRDIIFAEADGNYCYLHTPRRRFVIKTSLHKISEKLSMHAFVQIHRSFVVRLECIKTIDFSANKVFVEQEQLPIGAHYKADLLQRFQRI